MELNDGSSQLAGWNILASRKAWSTVATEPEQHIETTINSAAMSTHSVFNWLLAAAMICDILLNSCVSVDA